MGLGKMPSGEGPQAAISQDPFCRPVYTKGRTQGCGQAGLEQDVPPQGLKGEWSQENKIKCGAKDGTLGRLSL